jgi:hypothetical protein
MARLHTEAVARWASGADFQSIPMLLAVSVSDEAGSGVGGRLDAHGSPKALRGRSCPGQPRTRRASVQRTARLRYARHAAVAFSDSLKGLDPRQLRRFTETWSVTRRKLTSRPVR